MVMSLVRLTVRFISLSNGIWFPMYENKYLYSNVILQYPMYSPCISPSGSATMHVDAQLTQNILLLLVVSYRGPLLSFNGSIVFFLCGISHILAQQVVGSGAFTCAPFSRFMKPFDLVLTDDFCQVPCIVYINQLVSVHRLPSDSAISSSDRCSHY